MGKPLRIAISTGDRPGILAAVTSHLFDIGGNLGDATFAVLGEGAELTVVCEVPTSVGEANLRSSLLKLTALEGADISVQTFDLSSTRTDMGSVTHRIRVRGQNQPGLVARLTECFDEFGANVVRMTAETLDKGSDYRIDFELWVAPERSSRLLGAASNIAESLGLSYEALDSSP